jgi:hypothetical protein
MIGQRGDSYAVTALSALQSPTEVHSSSQVERCSRLRKLSVLIPPIEISFIRGTSSNISENPVYRVKTDKSHYSAQKHRQFQYLSITLYSYIRGLLRYVEYFLFFPLSVLNNLRNFDVEKIFF